MIGALREWLLSVTAAAILCALAQGLIPPGPVRRVGRLTAGLVMAAALLSPLASLKGVEPEEWLESWQPQEEVQELEQQRDETMKTIIEEECSAYIVDKAAQYMHCIPDRKSTRLTPVTSRSRMPSSA